MLSNKLTKQKNESDIYLGRSVWEAAYKVLEYMRFCFHRQTPDNDMRRKSEEAAMVCPAGLMTLANSIFDMSFFV